ncbi:MAG: hypothetical protein LBO69_00190 [Ignavibacteria bacterium]|jgi:flagellar motility protein MotE (MotC chaperone)|nr:hypothetical protein [Ignavibacteria bacterium]
MDWKRLIFWLSIFLIVFAVLAISGTVMYLKRPNWLGIQNELADSLNKIDSIEKIQKIAKKEKEQLKKDTTRRNPVPLINISLDTLVEISPEQLNYFEKELYKKSEQLLVLQRDKDWTYNQSKKLKDTIKQLSEKIEKYNDSLKIYKSQAAVKSGDSKKIADEIAGFEKKIKDATTQFNNLQNSVKTKDEQIAKLQNDIKTAANDGSNLRKQVQSLQGDIANAKKETAASNKRFDSLQKAYKDLQDRYEKKKDSLSNQGYKKFADLYNGTNPKEVASIMENLEPEKAANILNRMQKKKAGKVIESMSPSKAAEVLKYTVDF